MMAIVYQLGRYNSFGTDTEMTITKKDGTQVEIYGKQIRRLSSGYIYVEKNKTIRWIGINDITSVAILPSDSTWEGLVCIFDRTTCENLHPLRKGSHEIER